MVEIGPGQLIGEIGFFSGGVRTAAVYAARDSEVLEIHRDAFEALTARVPDIQRAITRALAERLAGLATIARDRESADSLSARRMIAVVSAGEPPAGDEFLARFASRAPKRLKVRLLAPSDAPSLLRGGASAPSAYASALSAIETEHHLVICVASPTLDDWTEAVLRSCDQVLFVAGGAPASPGAVERMALELFPVSRRRLVLVEPSRVGFALPSREWRRERESFMLHHVALQDDDDLDSLWRFLTGNAIGLVASGGGAFGPGHVGIHKAFLERGFTFDIFGGASVGSAIAATFAFLMHPDDISAATQEMFVRRACLKRLAFPRYGLLDHHVFDQELRLRYPGDIEDLWKPFFAVATDLSTYSLRVMRSGPLWQALRASSAIPGVLPPWFGPDGHMLVDGGVTDNVPVGAMNALKSGPNLVIDLRPLSYRKFKVDYAAIPGRWSVLARTLAPWPAARKMPRAPGPVAVIQRSLFGNIRERIALADSPELALRPRRFRVRVS